MALNHTAGGGRQPSAPTYLLSFSLEPAAPSSLTITTAPQLLAEGPAPRLKVKKLKDGTLEVGVRQVRGSPRAMQQVAHVAAEPAVCKGVMC